MSHIDNIIALGNRMVTNLELMGVSSSFNDGGLTLADKILEISSGTAIFLFSDKSSAVTGGVLKLVAYVSDGGDPVENGVVSFYSGNTLLSSVNTDSNGICNIYYTIIETGDTASFTAVYDNITSNTVIVNLIGSFTLTTDRSILSKFHNQSATVSATLLNSSNNPISGELVKFNDNNGNLLGYDYTDNLGVASLTYNSVGYGDININANNNNSVSSPILLEDCVFFDDASTDQRSIYSTWNIYSHSYDSTNKYYVYRCAGSTFSTVYVPLTLPTNMIVEADMLCSSGSNNQPRICIMKNQSDYIGMRVLTPNSANTTGIMMAHYNSGSDWANYVTNSTESINTSTWYHTKLIYKDNNLTGVLTKTNDNKILATDNINVSVNLIGAGIGVVASYVYTYFKNLKVKKIN